MMVYKYDENTQRMQYVYVDSAVNVVDESAVVTEEGKQWYRATLQAVHTNGKEYLEQLLVELANLKFDEDK